MTTEHDPYVLPDPELEALLAGAPWRRMVVVGDSIAEGVREAVEGWRDLSWTDRIALAVPGLEQRNLGVRDKLAAQVRAQQLGAALAFRPDLAVVSAGGNDALRPSFDPAAVQAELERIVAPLRTSGAEVLLLELMDIVAAGLVPEPYAGTARRAPRAARPGSRARSPGCTAPTSCGCGRTPRAPTRRSTRATGSTSPPGDTRSWRRRRCAASRRRRRRSQRPERTEGGGLSPRAAPPGRPRAPCRSP
jgi:hypothetical protein